MSKQITIVLVAVAALASGVSKAQNSDASEVGQPITIHQEWRFDSQGNPATPEVATGATDVGRLLIAPGEFSSGWIQQDDMLGIDTGIWDLGRSGSMSLSNLAGLAGGSSPTRMISVQVTQWRDGAIYDDLALVSVPSAVFAGTEATITSAELVGDWVVDRTLWAVPAGAVVDAVTITGAYDGSLIDRVVVEMESVQPVPVTLSVLRLAGVPHPIEVSWSSPSNGGVLESTTNLMDAQSWRPVDAPVQVDGERHAVTIESTAASQFFRLK